MVSPQMVMYEEEFNQIQTVVDRLVRDANANVVFIVDKNGQLIASSGDTAHLDTTSLASLTAGNIAATGGIAKLLRENEFSTQFHEGERSNIHIQLVGNRVILHSGVVLGSDGFGYEFQGGRHVKIPQVGIVQVVERNEGGEYTVADVRMGLTDFDPQAGIYRISVDFTYYR